MHEAVTLIGHNAGHDAFDVTELAGPEPSRPLASGADRPHRPPAARRAPGGLAEPPEVEVRVSARRKKTSEARWDGGRIVVSAGASRRGVEAEDDRLAGQPAAHPRAWLPADDGALLARAIDLSDRYLVGARPVSVRWVTNQTARWGSCSYYSGEIRVSHRLRVVPQWVLDSVLVHEVAHLDVPGPLPGLSPAGRGLPAPRRGGDCSWPATGLGCPIPRRRPCANGPVFAIF